MSKSKKKALPPVDLKFLRKFDFIDSVGDVASREVCVMSGLYLATEIAAGKITLKEALEGYPDGSYVEMTDRVDCVHPILNTLAIHRNDAFIDPKKRKAWALKTLPRLLGTKGNAKNEIRLNRIAEVVMEKIRDAKIKDLVAKYYKRKDPDFLNEAHDLAIESLSISELDDLPVEHMDAVMKAMFAAAGK